MPITLHADVEAHGSRIEQHRTQTTPAQARITKDTTARQAASADSQRQRIMGTTKRFLDSGEIDDFSAGAQAEQGMNAIGDKRRRYRNVPLRILLHLQSPGEFASSFNRIARKTPVSAPANQAIRPIRCDKMQVLTLAPRSDGAPIGSTQQVDPRLGVVGSQLLFLLQGRPALLDGLGGPGSALRKRPQQRAVPQPRANHHGTTRSCDVDTPSPCPHWSQEGRIWICAAGAGDGWWR